MTYMTRRWFAAATLLGAVLPFEAADAQTYPTKPVTMIVPFAPGGAVDVVGRLLATHLSARLGQQVVVENRPGAGANLGAEAVARAVPDGYTLFLTSPGPLVINQFLYRRLAFDPVRDFAPIALVARNPSILVVNPSFPARTPQEWLAAVRARPGAFNYATSGNGTTGHIMMEMLKTRAGLDITHVPYRGAAPAMQDLIGGRVEMTIDTITSVAGQITGGQVRPIAVSTARRWPGLPEVPTFAESGLEGFDAASWIGLVAPAGTAPAIVSRLAAEVASFVADSAARERFATLGAEPSGIGPEAFAAFIVEERAAWERGVRASGAQID